MSKIKEQVEHVKITEEEVVDKLIDLFKLYMEKGKIKFEDEFINLSYKVGYEYAFKDAKFLADVYSLLKGKKIKQENVKYIKPVQKISEEIKIESDVLAIIKNEDDENELVLDLNMQNSNYEKLNKDMLKHLDIICVNQFEERDYKYNFIYESYWFMPKDVAHDFNDTDCYICSYYCQSESGGHLTENSINVIDLEKMKSSEDIKFKELAKLFFATSEDDIKDMTTDIGKQGAKLLMSIDERVKFKNLVVLPLSEEESSSN